VRLEGKALAVELEGDAGDAGLRDEGRAIDLTGKVEVHGVGGAHAGAFRLRGRDGELADDEVGARLSRVRLERAVRIHGHEAGL